MPALNQPVRSYPLRPINEPALYVMGDKIGNQVPLPNHPDRQIGFGGMGNPKAMLAQQNSNLEALERRNPRDRTTGLTAVRPICYTSYHSQTVVSAQCLLLDWRMTTLQTSLTQFRPGCLPSHGTSGTTNS